MVIDYYACMCCAATDHCLMYREKWGRENNTVCTNGIYVYNQKFNFEYTVNLRSSPIKFKLQCSF